MLFLSLVTSGVLLTSFIVYCGISKAWRKPASPQVASSSVAQAQGGRHLLHKHEHQSDDIGPQQNDSGDFDISGSAMDSSKTSSRHSVALDLPFPDVENEANHGQGQEQLCKGAQQARQPNGLTAAQIGDARMAPADHTSGALPLLLSRLTIKRPCACNGGARATRTPLPTATAATTAATAAPSMATRTAVAPTEAAAARPSHNVTSLLCSKLTLTHATRLAQSRVGSPAPSTLLPSLEASAAPAAATTVTMAASETAGLSHNVKSLLCSKFTLTHAARLAHSRVGSPATSSPSPSPEASTAANAATAAMAPVVPSQEQAAEEKHASDGHSEEREDDRQKQQEEEKEAEAGEAGEAGKAREGELKTGRVEEGEGQETGYEGGGPREESGVDVKRQQPALAVTEGESDHAQEDVQEQPPADAQPVAVAVEGRQQEEDQEQPQQPQQRAESQAPQQQQSPPPQQQQRHAKLGLHESPESGWETGVAWTARASRTSIMSPTTTATSGDWSPINTEAFASPEPFSGASSTRNTSPDSSVSGGSAPPREPWRQTVPFLPMPRYDEQGRLDPSVYVVREGQWQPDKGTKDCRACGTGFSWTIRRHHCRTCGGIACARCSPRHPITGQRCCPTCALHLTILVFNLKDNPLFHGRITDVETEARLARVRGASPFLLRVSNSNMGQLVVSALFRGEHAVMPVKGVPGALYIADYTDERSSLDGLLQVLKDRGIAVTCCARPSIRLSDDATHTCPTCNRDIQDNLCVCGSMVTIPTHPAATQADAARVAGDDEDLLSFDSQPPLDERFHDDPRADLLGPHLLSSSNVSLGRVLGKGRSARVHVGTYDGKRMAIKKCRHSRHSSAIIDEALVLATLDHRNVLKLHGVCLDTTLPKLVTSYCARGNLRSYLRRHSPTSLKPRRLHNFALGVARGMEYLAGRSVVHADLCASNVLIAENYEPKIADFALAFYPGSGRAPPRAEDLPVRWTAPECLRGDTGAWSSAADAWSFGVLLFEIYSRGTRPYDHLTCNSNVWEGVAEGVLQLEEPPLAPDAIKAIITTMCLLQPASQRATFPQLREAVQAITL